MTTTPEAGHPSAPRPRRFATYHTDGLLRENRGPERERYDQVAQVIRELDADVIAMQDLDATPEIVRRRMDDLEDMTGMTATVTPSWLDEEDAGYATYAIAAGTHARCTVLLWRNDPGIRPEPPSLQAVGGEDLHHSLLTLTLEIDSVPVTFASYQAPTIGQNARADEAEHIVTTVTPPPGMALLLGAGMNVIGASRITTADGTTRYYDPDPYAEVDWFADLVHHCDWHDDDGVRRQRANRKATDVLVSGGLRDAAAQLDAPFAPTVGHHRLDECGRHGIRRRVDHIYTMGPLTLHDYRVFDTQAARTASSHLPVYATFTVPQ